MTKAATSSAGSDPEPRSPRQLSSDPRSGQAWWFLDTLALVRNPPGAPRTPVVLEQTVPPGGSPPRHYHEHSDESFLVLEGECVVSAGDDVLIGRPGTYVSVPAGTEHTFRVTGATPLRMLEVDTNDDFLGFIEAVGTPADELRVPPPGKSNLDLDALVTIGRAHDTHIVGPSLAEDVAREVVGRRREPPTLGPINHVALAVSNLGRSRAWYCAAFDLSPLDGEVAPDGTGHVTLVSPSGGWILALHSAPVAGVDHVAFTCDDRAALVRWQEALTKRSIEPGSITDAPYGSGFVARDPDGIEVELFAPAPMPASVAAPM